MESKNETLENAVTPEMAEPVPQEPAEAEAPVQEAVPAEESAVNEPAPQVEAPAEQPVQEEIPAQEAAPVQEPAPENPAQEASVPPQENPPQEPPVNKKSFIRASGGWTDIFVIAAVLSVLLMLYGDFIRVLFMVHFPINEWLLPVIPNKDTITFLMMYFGPIGCWVAFILVALVFKNNRPMFKSFFYNGHGNNIRAIFIGILLGGGMNAACVFMSWLRGDIVLSFNEFNPLLFFAFLFCVWIQSGSEEILDRLYLYQKLRRRYRWPAIAIIFNALVFSALHAGNPGVTMMGLLQVFEIGILFSLIVYFYDSLWTAIWAHTAWNFSQSIVFGLPNSGIVSSYSVFKLDAASARDGLFYSTSFGVEGSIGANVIIGAVILIVLIAALVRKRGEKVDLWEDLENEIAVKGREKRTWEAVIWAVLIIAVFAALLAPQLMAIFTEAKGMISWPGM